MSKVELTLNTGDVATIEVQDDTGDMILFLIGKTAEQPPHPDDRAKEIADRITAAQQGADGLSIVGIHVVTAEEQADRTAAQYRDMANRTLERMERPPLADHEGPQ